MQRQGLGPKGTGGILPQVGDMSAVGLDKVWASDSSRAGSWMDSPCDKVVSFSTWNMLSLGWVVFPTVLGVHSISLGTVHAKQVGYH